MTRPSNKDLYIYINRNEGEFMCIGGGGGGGGGRGGGGRYFVENRGGWPWKLGLFGSQLSTEIRVYKDHISSGYSNFCVT